MVVVLELAGEIGLVGAEVEEAVTGEVEEDGLRLALFLGGKASSMAVRMACEDSGAGRMPSVRTKSWAASKTFVWGTATASIRPRW